MTDETPQRDAKDELPHDLDRHGYVGPYQFPDNSRRRIPGTAYLVIAAGVVALVALVDDSPFLNRGSIAAAIGLVALGIYHLQAGWRLGLKETDALVVAVRHVGFPVGHASAQMTWRGIRSRPIWRILVYSIESPPLRRGFIVVDGVDGTVVASHVEDNPEEWSINDA